MSDFGGRQVRSGPTAGRTQHSQIRPTPTTVSLSISRGASFAVSAAHWVGAPVSPRQPSFECRSRLASHCHQLQLSPLARPELLHRLRLVDGAPVSLSTAKGPTEPVSNRLLAHRPFPHLSTSLPSSQTTGRASLRRTRQTQDSLKPYNPFLIRSALGRYPLPSLP